VFLLKEELVRLSWARKNACEGVTSSFCVGCPFCRKSCLQEDVLGGEVYLDLGGTLDSWLLFGEGLC